LTNTWPEAKFSRITRRDSGPEIRNRGVAMYAGKFRGALLGSLLILVPGIVAAQGPGRLAASRQRLDNVNLLTFGAGRAEYSHPNFEAHNYPTFAYERRILRREIRPVPIWVRGAFQFLSDDSHCDNCFRVWGANDQSPFPERVSEHTTDLAIRAEALADVLHTPHSALYGGLGFVLHTLNFSSKGNVSGIPTFNASLTETSPSPFFGLRLFSATQTYTGYAEVRYGRVFGKTDDRQGKAYLTDETFAFKGVNAAFLESGLGFHW
jgi:hypothetical protein